MKKTISIIASLVISANAYNIDIKKGWQLNGALEDINVSAFNKPEITSVWTYDSDTYKWRVYLPNKPEVMDSLPSTVERLDVIKAGEGYWVDANSYVPISTTVIPQDTTVDTNEDNTTTESADTTEQNLSLRLIPTPTDFTLDDIANQTFKVNMNDQLCDLSFDDKGNGVITISNRDYNLKLENGTINVYNSDNFLILSFKKITSDDNGIILLTTDHNYTYLDSWIKEINPVDMSSILPITYYEAESYSDYGGNTYLDSWKDIYDTNNTMSEYYLNQDTNSYELRNESNFTIEDGQIVSEHKSEWKDENNNTVTNTYTETSQIVSSINNFDVVLHTDKDILTYTDENLKDKTWDDIIDNNISVFGYNFPSNGIIMTSNDYNITYNIDNNTAILTYTEDYGSINYIWERNITLDSDTGEVTSIDTFTWIDTYSKDPLIENVNEDNTTTVIRNIKTVTNPIKEYQERPYKILERMKRGF